MRGSRERRQAQALQDALERYERAVGLGTDADDARSQAASGLGELARPFALATSMVDAAAPIEPDAVFARRVAMQLRSAQVVVRPAVRRRAPRFGFAPLAAAAAVVAAAVVLIPSFGALPGQPLYAVKGMAEDARVWFADGPWEARVRLSLANERFEEVEELIDASRVQVLGGPGVLAASSSVADIDDPELAHLIEGALRNAGEQLEAAAEILTEEPAQQEDLDALVEVTSRGRALATDVAEELPNADQSPVLRSVVKLAKIEAKAKAAQENARADAEPTPDPCPSPTPTPTPSPTPDASATPTPTPTPTPSPSPTPSPTADADESPASDQAAAVSDDPCPSPSPTPTPSPTATPQPATEPSPAGAEEQSATVDETDDGEGSDVPTEPEESHRRPLYPFGERA